MPLLVGLATAVRQQEWSEVSQLNQRIQLALQNQGLSAEQQQQVRQIYQAALQQCQHQADHFKEKMQQTLAKREAMNAYACFSDNDSFCGE